PYGLVVRFPTVSKPFSASAGQPVLSQCPQGSIPVRQNHLVLQSQGQQRKRTTSPYGQRLGTLRGVRRGGQWGSPPRLPGRGEGDLATPPGVPLPNVQQY